MQSFDLGHLEILEVLLEEQSVSKAALRLHVSPSAISRTLATMRAAVGDELLVQSGRNLALTRRGSELQAKVKKLNEQARRLLSPPQVLDPRHIRRTYRIRASDYSSVVIGSPLIEELGKRAPRAKISFVSQGKDDLTSLRQGNIDFDLGVPHEMHPEIVNEPLFKDRFICAFSKSAGAGGSRPTLTEFCQKPHVVVSRKAKTSVLIDELLARQGKERRIIATVSSFQEALLMASRSNLWAQAPSRLVEMLRAPLGLRTCPIPIRTPEIELTLGWHSRNRDDQEHQWLRALILELVHAL